MPVAWHPKRWWKKEKGNRSNFYRLMLLVYNMEELENFITENYA